MSQPARGGVDRWFFHSLEQNGIQRRYPRGATIFLQDQAADKVHFLTRGQVKMALLSPDGMERTLLHVEPNHFFGEFATFIGGPYGVTATAARDSTVIVIPSQDFLTLLKENWEINLYVHRTQAQKIWKLGEEHVTSTFLTIPGRTAWWLLRLWGNREGDPLVEVTHDELSRLIGCSRVAVTRALKQFESEGIIGTSRRCIRLLEPSHLRRWATQTQGSVTEWE